MLLAAVSAQAAEPPPKVEVALVAPAQASVDAPFLVAVVLKVPAGWHIYWENPGQSGLPTDVRLVALPEEVPPQRRAPPPPTVTGPRWPVPTRFTSDGLVNYGYEGDTAFVFDVRTRGPLTLRAEASWLLCKDVCVAGSGTAEAEVAIARPREALASAPAFPFLAWLPRPFAESGGTVALEGGQLRITLPGPGPFDVFPSIPLEGAWSPTLTTAADGSLLLTSPLASVPTGAHLVLTRGAGTARAGFTLTLPEK